MKVSSLLKGDIYEVSFGYNPKMEGYTTLMSDISKLYAIPEPVRNLMKKGIYPIDIHKNIRQKDGVV